MAAAALNRTQERKANTSNGGLMLLITLIVLALMIWSIVALIRDENAVNGIGTIVLAVVLTLQL
ncbi:MAG: hypothetical protein AB7O98_14775 [Hyphomonadaceae bacterium]